MAKGDHFFVWRFDCVVPYQHHAVDLGDGTVVHYTAVDGGGARPLRRLSQQAVSQTAIEKVTRGGKDRIHVVQAASPERADEVAQRATSQVGRAKYCLFFHNCEHFATWAATGRWQSNQIATAAQRGGSVLLKTIACAGTRLTARVAFKGVTRLGHPLLITSDAIQFGTEALGQHIGLTDRGKRQNVGRGVGFATAIGLGALAGPAGIAFAGGTWIAGELAGGGCRKILDGRSASSN